MYQPAEAQAPVRTVKDFTPAELVVYYASVYHVSAQQMTDTIQCESRFNPNAVGDHGKSFGLSQIYLPAHKNITKEQALDPIFSIEFMAKSFKQGKQNMWTCTRLLGYNKAISEQHSS